MADELLRSKHGFGSSENIQDAIDAKKVDEYDILFLDGETDNPKVGWIDKNGKSVIVKSVSPELEASIESLETEVAGKASAEEVDAKVSAVEEKVADVETKVSEVKEEILADVDEKVEVSIESAIEDLETSLEKADYEISGEPEGTLVNYFDKEIRIMVPANTDFTQSNGINGAENTFYIENRIYAPENAVRYRVNFGGTVTEGAVEDFSGCTDEHGRIYIVTTPPIAYYDTASAAWVYYGASSTVNHYIGWDLITDFYDENGVMIASDSIRITLSNEDCHYVIEPYYIGETVKTLKYYADEQIANVVSGFTIVEF